MLKKAIEEKIETSILIKFLKLKLKYENKLISMSFEKTFKKSNESLYDFRERYIEEINDLANEVFNEALKMLLKKDLFFYSLFNRKKLFDSFEESFKVLNDDLNIFLSKNIYQLQVYITEQEEEKNPFINDWAH